MSGGSKAQSGRSGWCVTGGIAPSRSRTDFSVREFLHSGALQGEAGASRRVAPAGGTLARNAALSSGKAWKAQAMAPFCWSDPVLSRHGLGCQAKYSYLPGFTRLVESRTRFTKPSRTCKVRRDKNLAALATARFAQFATRLCSTFTRAGKIWPRLNITRNCRTPCALLNWSNRCSTIP